MWHFLGFYDSLRLFSYICIQIIIIKLHNIYLHNELISIFITSMFVTLIKFLMAMDIFSLNHFYRPTKYKLHLIISHFYYFNFYQILITMSYYLSNIIFIMKNSFNNFYRCMIIGVKEKVFMIWWSYQYKYKYLNYLNNLFFKIINSSKIFMI